MDDETLGAGGTIMKHLERGDAVTVCVACKRAYDHRFDPILVEEEKQSAKAAARVLGVRDLRFLDLEDERLDEKLLNLLIPLEACVREVSPSVIYTHHRGDTHQDHRAVFHATMIAARTFAPHRVTRLLSYEVPSSTEQAPPFPETVFQPNHYVDISPFLRSKLEAMKAYRRELREFPHPRSLKGIEVLAQKRGMDSGCPAAEAFMIVRDLWV